MPTDLEKEDGSKIFTRRAFVVGCVQGGILAVLGGRLAWLQVVEGQRYKRLSDKNRIDVKMLAPSRGEIFDRKGVKLAENEQNFRVLLIPEQTKTIESSLRALQNVIDLSEKEIEKTLDQAKRLAKFVPLEVKDKLSWRDVSKIEVNLPDLPGLSINVGELRHYPLKEATAHIVGYVGAVDRNDIKKDPMLALPGFKTGKTGIEKSYEVEMRGLSGASEVEVNVIGREVRELNRKDARKGKSVVLSIDAGCQTFMQTRLSREKSASAVVIDAHTGAVYAMASHPGFDPNDFTRGLSAATWEGLLANPGFPLTNKAIAGHYPPASTFKMVTALAALRAGVTDAGRKAYCGGYYEYGGDRFHCWNPVGHGHVNLVQSLVKSCDTYFYEISTEVGIDNISAMARMMGLGAKYGFELKEERPGLVPDKNWKMGYFGEHWRPGETIVASIGQSYLQSTPLQMAVMTARMVNGGYAVEPWMTGYIGAQSFQKEQWDKLDIDPAHLTLIQKGMHDVVNNKRGTAYKSRIQKKGHEMGGKTGTAQVKKITLKQRYAGAKNEDLPWEQRHHALFVGYAPVLKPRYVCAVVVEHGVGGSLTAAPLARDLLAEVQRIAPAGQLIQPQSTIRTEG